ncbi:MULTISPECIES: hypothetical protein [unclassified Phyllobacterium]|uniref:hypothetical protein n=1 Tax=unclassified Phyllobacterium TaxID=2638441 RepID=UPI003012B297
MKNTDASWKRKLFDDAIKQQKFDNGYWLDPFLYYKSDCPYLVGSYDHIRSCFTRLKKQGVDTIIVDVVSHPVEFGHIRHAFVPFITG